MQSPLTPRSLTYDEKKAAEAAFLGLPVDPKWSAAARSVHEGILKVSRAGAQTKDSASSPGSESREAAAGQPTEAATPPPLPAGSPRDQDQADSGQQQQASSPLRTREEAIQAGRLIDVSPLAQSLGLPLPVGITKPLWDLAITVSQAIPNNQHESRMRDVLMALRLRLAASRTTMPWIEFPVLLAFPPEPIPQLCLLHAVAHGDPSNILSLTLALREEVSLIISPLNK